MRAGGNALTLRGPSIRTKALSRDTFSQAGGSEEGLVPQPLRFSRLLVITTYPLSVLTGRVAERQVGCRIPCVFQGCGFDFAAIPSLSHFNGLIARSSIPAERST